MKLRYIIPALLFIVIAFIGLILPERNKSPELKPEELLSEIIKPNRFLTTDQIADRLVNEDPSLTLIDVRGFYDYDEFSLPGAINVPLEEILLEDWQEYFEQTGKDVVLYSNADILADQAWILLKRKEYNRIFVLRGGVNEWFRTIINPPIPSPTDPQEAMDLYQFRRGARQYFLGGGLVEMPEVEAEQVTVTRKKKKAVAEGGC
jgi:rhodanese-related sulfurtransferase